MVYQRVVCPDLIGRDAPLATVLNTLERARSAHGSTLLVSGEAGIGKSRMVRAAIEQARAWGFVTLEGASFETDRALPYAPLLDLVRELAATTSTALAAHYFAPAAAELLALFPELHSVFPTTVPTPRDDPDEARRRLHYAVGEALVALAHTQPVLLVVEDVHWSDDATLDLLRQLSRRITPCAIVITLVFRSDEIGPSLARLLSDLDRSRAAADVPLRLLTVAECAAMVRAIFGEHDAFDHTFVSRLHEVTEGNPFFIEEMLKVLVMAGDLQYTDNVWYARPFDQIPVPRSATEAVGRRLAGLSVHAREIASVAAVAGRRFDFGLLQRITQHDDRTLLAAMKELVNAQLVVEESADRFAFRHALSRESLRNRLLARERMVLHRAIAVALELPRGERTDDVDNALAYHTFEAGDWALAVRYASRAASRAVALGAPREALVQFNRAIAATEHTGEPIAPALFLARGRAHETLGAFPQAEDDFESALGAARRSRDARDEWEALHASGLLWSARDYGRAGAYRQRALDVARTINDPVLIARSLNRVGNWHVNREDLEIGIPFHHEARELFERINDLHGVAETVDLLAMAYHLSGAQHVAVPLYEQSIELFTALDNRRALANALSVLTVCGPSHHGSASDATISKHANDILTHERPVRIAADIGWRAGEAFARYLLADSLTWRGEYTRARVQAHEALAIAEDIAHREWQAGAQRTLGFIAVDLGDIDTAVREHERAHAVARQLNSATWMRWTGAALATALVHARQFERANELLDDIRELVPPSSSRVIVPASATPTLGERSLTLARAELALARGEFEQAHVLLPEFRFAESPRAALLQARIFIAQTQWDDATVMLDLARTEATTQGAQPILWRIEAAHGEVHLGRRKRRNARRSFDTARAVAKDMIDALDDETMAAALWESVDRLAPPPPSKTAAQKAKAKYGGLTRRERDTAALIAEGKSNRAISRALGIGERTVEGYVSGALSKLRLSSRAQLAVWAVDRGLAAKPLPSA